MPIRWNRAAAVLAGCLLASLSQAQFTYSTRHGDMEAQLTVEAAKQTLERGLGTVTLTVTVTGPPTLDVEEPRLGDAAAAWKEERLTSTRQVQDQGAVWSEVIRLHQVKRGIESVPDVTVRFRPYPEAEWIEEKWIDILRNVHDYSGLPQPQAEEPSWLRRWGFLLILTATSGLVLFVWLRRRRPFRREAPLPPDRWALREIERIDKTLMPPLGEAETYHTQMSFVVRRYLAERFALRALQQTTAEFLEAVGQFQQMPAEDRELLTELFQRCDLAKFAQAGTSAEECQRTAELARTLVHQTTFRPHSQRGCEGFTRI